MYEIMAGMETDRVLRLEMWVGRLLILCWGVWTLFHWHRPANRITDMFAALAGIGSIVILRVLFKSRGQISN